MKFKGKGSKRKFSDILKGKSIKELQGLRVDVEKDVMRMSARLQKAGYAQGQKGNMRDLKKNIARIETAITVKMGKQGRV
jgi:ribosomal protein L29